MHRYKSVLLILPPGLIYFHHLCLRSSSIASLPPVRSRESAQLASNYLATRYWAARSESRVDVPSSNRTRTLSVEPVESMTVMRAKPGPSGTKNRVPRSCDCTRTPLTSSVIGASFIGRTIKTRKPQSWRSAKSAKIHSRAGPHAKMPKTALLTANRLILARSRAVA